MAGVAQRGFGLLLALVALACAVPSAMFAQSPAQLIAIMSGAPAAYPGAVLALDFVGSKTNGQQYYLVGGGHSSQFAGLPGLSVSRASVGYAANADGSLVLFPANAPRITNQGLLVEEARTNLFLQSQNPTITWGISAATAAANVGAAPDGTATAGSIVPTAAVAAHPWSQSVTHTAASYTVSGYVKPSGYTRFGVRENTSSGAYAAWDLSAGTVLTTSNATATIAAVSGGWYRVSFTFTGAALSQQLGFYVMDAGYASGSPQAYTFAGNGTSGVLVWGFQDELGAFPTSYIPTTSASATRAADVVQISGLAAAGSGTFLAKALLPAFTAGSNFVGLLDDGVQHNGYFLFRQGSGNAAVQTVSNSVTTSLTGGSISSAGAYRFGVSNDGTNSRAAVNGSLITAAAGSAPISPLSRLMIGAGSGGAIQSNGYIQSVVYYATAYNDAQIQAATQ